MAETTIYLAGAHSATAVEIANLVRNQLLANSAVAARTRQNVTSGTVLRLLSALAIAG